MQDIHDDCDAVHEYENVPAASHTGCPLARPFSLVDVLLERATTILVNFIDRVADLKIHHATRCLLFGGAIDLVIIFNAVADVPIYDTSLLLSCQF